MATLHSSRRVVISGIPTPSMSLSDLQSCSEEASRKKQAEFLAERLAVVCRHDADTRQLLAALTDIRKELSSQMCAPIQTLIDLNGVAALVKRLGDATGAVQLEVAWALTNLACGTAAQTTALIDAGAAEAIFEVLLSREIDQRPEVCDQCLWVLGNIPGAGAQHRDRLLHAGIVGVLGQLYQQIPDFSWHLHFRTQVLRTLTWLMSSLCRGQPAPPIEEVDCAFDFFAQVLAGTEDVQMLSEALWGLCYLLESAVGDEEQRERGSRLLSAGFEPPETPPTPHPVILRIVECAQLIGVSGNPAPVPALRVLGQMVSMSTEELTDAALAAGALNALQDTLQDRRVPTQVRRDAAWALQNIAAGKLPQAERILDVDGGAWLALTTALQNDSFEVSRECAWAVANLAKGDSKVLARMDGVQVIELTVAALRAELLHSRRHQLGTAGTGEATAMEPDAALVRALLDACEAVVKHHRSSSGGSAEALAEEHGVLDVLGEILQPGALPYSDAVHRKAAYLLQIWRQVSSPASKRAALSTGSSPGPSSGCVSRSPISSCPTSPVFACRARRKSRGGA